VTDDQGNVVNYYDYLPYGEKIASKESVATNETTFGSKDDDDLSGFVYMNARYYDPRLGRFLSADSLIPSIYRPQSLNRYSYVENDPVNFWDPSGHMPMRVELKKEREAQSRAAFASVSGGCALSGTGYSCSVPFDVGWGEILANSTPRKFNAQGETVRKRVGGEWKKEDLPPWSVLAEPLSPPPLVSLEQADEPYLTSPDEWAAFPNLEVAESHVKFLASQDRICIYCTFEAIRWRSNNVYLYTWLIGPIIPGVITPELAMAAMQSQFNAVFPFDVTGTAGELSLIPGAKYNLERTLYPGRVDPITVVEATATSLTFETEPGHFRGEGQFVGFRTYAAEGYLYLQQFGTNEGTPLDWVYNQGASRTWRTQADNLRGLLYGHGRREVYPPSWLGK
jgi:RHS repeat-associated protein